MHEMEPKKILITRPVYEDVEEQLKQYFDVVVNRGEKFSSEQLAEALRDVDGLLVAGGDRVNAEIIRYANKLKAVCVTAAGYNSIDVEAMTKAGIMVTNSPGAADETVADFTWGLMISVARRLVEAERFVHEGNWNTSVGKRFFGIDVYGKTLGIIGMGRIGRAIARRAEGFKMEVLYNNRNRLDKKTEEECNAVYQTKEELLKASNFVVLALPFAEGNYHIIGRQEFGLMQPSSIIINIARGGLIDEAALAEALEQHKIAGAGLDVFEEEPNIYPALMNLPNVVLTPHIAGATYATQHALTRIGAENLIAALGYGPDAFHPPALINKEVQKKKD